MADDFINLITSYLEPIRDLKCLGCDKYIGNCIMAFHLNMHCFECKVMYCISCYVHKKYLHTILTENKDICYKCLHKYIDLPVDIILQILKYVK